MHIPSTFKISRRCFQLWRGTAPRFHKRYGNLFFKLFLLLALAITQAMKSHDFSMNIPAAANAGMRATVGCGGGAALGSSFGPVGTITGIIIGSLIGFLVNKCARRVDHKYDGLLFNDATSETNKVSTKTVEDIISESEAGEEKQFCKQFIKKGGYKEVLEDFESLGLSGIKDMHRGKVGTLPDGRTVNVRVESLDKRPTLEIQPLKRGEKIYQD